MNYLLVAVNIALLVTGQAMWKIGIASLSLHGIGDLLRALFSPWILGGVLLYGVATLVWIYLLKQLPLSLLYPMQSLAYVAAVLVALVFFHETVPVTRWIGLGIILIGVLFVAR
ncbi:EamA family transporter [Alicyclobacillus macrosporangiidus]|jgi:drug/metabolite transporter (DMT)-like permease|uniref:EamA-like transporter family protein n=1 Tax=Alicyclobacillus macrosporangiidus TaxID=392015 RepID=A0A1I7K8Q0_9BACL|nr:EamA family transporter [Alicyclobacillus macrosporangiidus]SFU93826.1 EamA-like transporter family protein [Alicyclobacillus macrosporangiidus]